MTTTSVTTQTFTRNAPPVMIMSEPEPVQTIETTLVVVGTNTTSPDFESTIVSSISAILGVDPRRVAVTGSTQTWAAVVENGVPDDGGRLLQSRELSILERALEVNFQVAMPAESAEVTTASSQVEAMVAAISDMKANPGELLDKLSEVLPIDNLRLRLTTPFVRQKQAVFVAEDWGACARGLACVATRFPLRYRQVWCADSDNVSIALLPELCSGLMPRMEEPCPANLIPPECGWTIGSWSPCFSLPPSEVTDNATEQCNATGMGKQYRGVSCLSSGSVPEADECKLPRPSGDRSCRCISSQVSQLSLLDQGMGDSSVQVASASMTLVGVLTACILCTCISFGCFLLTSRKSTAVKKADALAEFDSYVLTSKEKQYKQRVAPAAPAQEQQDVTVCVANSRQNTRELTSDFDTASTASVGSAIPSPTSTGSRTTQMAPLASPCSVSSVASQPVRMSPLPSPSTLSISSISAVLQSPAHSAGYGSGAAESGETVFLALSSPSNAGSPTRSPQRRPTLPAVSETEAHLTQTSPEPPVDHPHSLASDELRSAQVASARPRRKKNAPRPPTLQMDLCGPEEDQDAVPFASPSKRSPQKARDTPAERGDFSPAWLQPRGDVSFHNKASGTPAHSVRAELGVDSQEPPALALPPQPRLPRPPALESPGPVPPPPMPLENRPKPPEKPPE
ncbi:unnamed protein product, partial [Symbiodinium sp. CCMP2456]